MDICCLFYYPAPALICLIIKDWPGKGGRRENTAPAKQTIPDTVVVTEGRARFVLVIAACKVTRAEEQFALTLQVLAEDKLSLLRIRCIRVIQLQLVHYFMRRNIS